MSFHVAVDCRWLGLWGAGRVTELLLRGLAEDPPDRPWALWGRPSVVEPYAWPDATVLPDDGDPRRWRGQRAWFGVPDASVVLFGHQRPLRRVPAVTWIFDTIQLRYGGTAAERRVRRQYLRRLAAVSGTVLTISEHSRASIERDLGVDAARISVVTLPVDWAQAERVRDLRARARAAGGTGPPTAVFVGRFAPHKNLARLVTAFERSAFRAAGGRLVLVGGSLTEVAAVTAALTPTQRPVVEVRGRCDDAALAVLLASATLLVQPSLEEGFGLPVAEALAAGVPVCVSDGGALPEAAGGSAVPFPAESVEAMAAALDATVTGADPALSDRLVADARRRFPTVGGFAKQVRRVLERAAEASAT